MAMDVDVNDSKRQINIDKPRWDQSTYWGRVKHFYVTTNPLNLFASSEELEQARQVVTKYRKGDAIPGITEDELWRAKHLYDSAFHPETGEKMVLIGRMSAQVPMNMFITGSMLTFYKTTKAVVFWQWFNQSFNAVVNYSNRGGASKIDFPHLVASYLSATAGAVSVALGLNSLIKKSPPLLARFVPVTAVCAANCINIPIMRSKELFDGTPVIEKDSDKIMGHSKIAARWGIGTVVFSRVLMAVMAMGISPFFIHRLERTSKFARHPVVLAPLQVVVCGVILSVVTPMCCAVFPQQYPIAVSSLEPDIQERCRKLPNPPTTLYYNKGL